MWRHLSILSFCRISDVRSLCTILAWGFGTDSSLSIVLTSNKGFPPCVRSSTSYDSRRDFVCVDVKSIRACLLFVIEGRRKHAACVRYAPLGHVVGSGNDFSFIADMFNSWFASAAQFSHCTSNRAIIWTKYEGRLSGITLGLHSWWQHVHALRWSCQVSVASAQGTVRIILIHAVYVRRVRCWRAPLR
jgi:hypothetical protein